MATALPRRERSDEAPRSAVPHPRRGRVPHDAPGPARAAPRRSPSRSRQPEPDADAPRPINRSPRPRRRRSSPSPRRRSAPTQPEAGAPRPFRLPKVKPFTLKNGIKVFLVEQHDAAAGLDGPQLRRWRRRRSEGQGGPVERVHGDAHRGHRSSSTRSQYAEALADVASNINAYAGGRLAGRSRSTSLTKHLDTDVRAVRRDAARRPGSARRTSIG